MADILTKSLGFLVGGLVLLLAVMSYYISSYQPPPQDFNGELNQDSKYRPVIIFHGIFSSSSYMEDLVALIHSDFNGTEVYNIDGYDAEYSLLPMWRQVNEIKGRMLPIMQNAKDGVNLICFSQGGLVCRGILETTPEHNVHTFVSLSSPQAGQFGESVYLDNIFPDHATDGLYEVLYSRLGQDISVANYWRDPYQWELYKEYSSFLYPLNHPSDSSHKTNFERIEQLVLIGGPGDGVITPWQSSQFAFYDENEIIIDMENQMYFEKNTFGLQTLHSRGAIHSHIIPGVQHTQWHGNKDVFDCCIAPYLK
ncbi:lysosomal thioesterase PPT2-A-like [Halichondria panicea]|uniref:lysosomal thioesterase PPT2-A-like n=1 Tax=Halichondria panicea TaxID=6063 RepID=UPI00312B9716